MLENLPIGIYVLDKEQRVRFWNRGAEQITGYLAHEILGHVGRDQPGSSGSGQKVQVTKQNMAELKQQLEKRIQSIIDLEKLRKNIEMTVTREGLRIELLESNKGGLLQQRQSQAESERPGDAGATRKAVGASSQPPLDRRAHRCQTIWRQKQLQQLGTVRRPC